MVLVCLLFFAIFKHPVHALLCFLLILAHVQPISQISNSCCSRVFPSVLR